MITKLGSITRPNSKVKVKFGVKLEVFASVTFCLFKNSHDLLKSPDVSVFAKHYLLEDLPYWQNVQIDQNDKPGTKFCEDCNSYETGNFSAF